VDRQTTRWIACLGACLAVALASVQLLVAAAPAATFLSARESAFTGEGVEASWKFDPGIGAMECRASSSATLSEASSTLTINEIHLRGCGISGGFGVKAVTVEMEGCYTLIRIAGGRDGADVGDGPRGRLSGRARLLCPRGTFIRGYDDERFCEIAIRPQAGRAKLRYADDTAYGFDVSQVRTAGIGYDVIFDAPLCPLRAGDR
jgi:hypothetical protein